ncbi:COR domain-containing protein [Coleofasciculus sp. FACHB-129]|uniref:COR domain-containing protein n=1 Tax=Cyanophyceae TaxID=3028117 RepID=UPI001688B9C5|nr:COR domain-containing protein [Coleofasciculus sp. FACHB-129]MBD1893208.1 leucine-rich repeat domain-containing protein [Coleofasciculus sp. FACHB-129]
MARDEAYREAEQHIETARQEGATELNLRNLELTKMPESIGQLTNLQKLDLGSLPWEQPKNQLTELPEAIAALTQLQELDLSYNQLTELPEAIAALTQLQKLDLCDNELTELPEAIAALTQLQELNLSYNQLTELPEAIAALTQLQELDLSDNELTELPEEIAALTQLQKLDLCSNELTELPTSIGKLRLLKYLRVDANKFTDLPQSIGELLNLRKLFLGYDVGSPLIEFPSSIRSLKLLEELYISGCELQSLPIWLDELAELKKLILRENHLVDLPISLGRLLHLEQIELAGNPLNPDLAAAYEQGMEAVMQYLWAKAEGEETLNEAKLILVGEGEVGKSCLLGALRGDEWVDGRLSTHGIEIKPVIVTAPNNSTKITLNGWDFGGQRVYRPTHQLFFSAPAVYLVVWKPREGPQQGFVKEWITLIKHREPDAKMLVVATHGGPGQRRPDIDRQELIDLFGSDTIVGFFHIDSKPNVEIQCCTGIAELKEAIANIAATLPGMGRTVPTKWQDIREILEASGKTHLPYNEVIAICEKQGLKGFATELFVRVSHTLGYLIHYHYDPTLRDIVILKPDWLAKAISFVLDDETTRCRNGLVEFDHLSQLWSHPPFAGEEGYPKALHPVFVRLMERFDLSYRVVLDPTQPSTTSLIAQLVPDNRPAQLPGWGEQPETGDRQQVQICRIVDERGQLANAEGLFYQLIVRLHKYSLGRASYENSVHWQRGLMLDNDYNGRALLEQTSTEVKITVRAAYPEFFLYELTKEVKWLVEHFWEGLRCEVMVPCIEPCGRKQPGTGLFEVQKLIESKRQGMPKFPCMISGCNQWLDIDELMRNAPTSRQAPVEKIVVEEFRDVKDKLDNIFRDIRTLDSREHQRFQKLDENDRRILSQADERFAVLMQMLTDEAKDGPRLFSFKPIDPRFFDRPKWLSAKFQITLWCEHSRLPLPALNPTGSKQGVYELDLPREWFVKAVPLLKTMSFTLGLILPVAASATKLILDNTTYKGFEEQIELGQKSLESAMKGSELAAAWQSKTNTPDLEHGEAIRAQGAMLREIHALLKEKDPSFGGLEKVQNKRREFLWVHPQFVNEY